MIAVLAVLPAVVLGFAVVDRLLPAEGWPSRWTRWLTAASLGAGVGAGLTSILYFAMLWAGVQGRSVTLGVEAVLIVAAVLIWVRRPTSPASANVPPTRFAWQWALAGAGALGMILFFAGFRTSTQLYPGGEWDAFSIWNLRARYLAGGGEVWRNAVSDHLGGRMFGAHHPGYPLLLSGFVARTWTIAGSTTSEVPQVVSLLFSLATLGLLAGAVAWMRSLRLGLLALLVLLATEQFEGQAPIQYADIPLALYVLGAVVMLQASANWQWARGPLVLAGACAGFAAWTKNEGMVFGALVLGIALWRGGIRVTAWVMAGAAPGALITAAFKLWLAQGFEQMLPKTAGDAFAKLADPSRWFQIAASYVGSFAELGDVWSHPLLLLAVLAFTLGFLPKEQVRSRMWLLAPAVGLLAADFGVYLITQADLKWHLDTSNRRLIVQVWPALLFAYFLMLRTPVPPPQEVVAERPKKRKKKAEKK